MKQKKSALLLAKLQQKVILQDSAITQLKKITCPLIPISAIGPIIIGKSSLLNKIIASPIFQTGSSTNPTTKGIWVYPHYEHFADQKQRKICYLFIDVQGFDRLDSKGSSDLFLMTLMFLISYKILYMNRGALQSSTLGRINEVLKGMPHQLKNKPCLYLIQTQFNLKLLDQNGQYLSNEEYLQYCLSNIKNKEIVKNMTNFFEIDKSVNHRIMTFLMPNSTNSIPYQKKVNQLKKLFLTYPLDFTPLFYNTDFIPRLEIAVNKINEAIKLEEQFLELRDYQSFVQKTQKQAEVIARSQWRKKFELLQEELLKKLPLPEQLIEFRVEEKKKEVIGNSEGIYEKNILGKTVEEITSKCSLKLKKSNDKQIQTFFQNEVNNALKTSQLTEDIAQAKKLFDNLAQKLNSNFSFIKDSQIEQMKGYYWMKIAEKYSEKIVRRYKQSSQEAKGHQKIMKDKERLIKQLKQDREKEKRQEGIKMQQLEEQKCRLTLLVKQLQKRQAQLQCNQTEKQEIEQLKNSLREYQQLVLNNLNRQSKIYTEVSQIFVNPEPSQFKPPSKIMDNDSPSELVKWTRKIQKIQAYFVEKRETESAQILEQQQRISQLQKMNKMLRVQALQREESDALNLIEEQYKTLQKKNRELQAELLEKIKIKQKEIEQLIKQKGFMADSVHRMEEQNKILRCSLKDRGKGSEFLQTLIEEKESMLQSVRNQLMKTIETSSREAANLYKQKNKIMNELSQALADQNLKNQRLNNQSKILKQKIKSLESTLTKKYTEKLNQKEDEIQFLQKQLQSLETSVSSATQAYQQVTQKLEGIIQNKQLKISKLSGEFENLVFEKNRIRKNYEESLQELQRLKADKRNLEIDRDRNLSEDKKEISLLENKCSYLNKIIEKLKMEIRQKQSTFDVMLKQLRAQNLISHNRGQEQRLEKQNISQIQKMITKNIDEIDCLNYLHSSESKPKSFVSSNKKIKSAIKPRLPLNQYSMNQHQTVKKQQPFKPQRLQFKFLEVDLPQSISIKNEDRSLKEANSLQFHQSKSINSQQLPQSTMSSFGFYNISKR